MGTTYATAGHANSTIVDRYSIAVLIPCYNGELAIASVIAEFRNSLPNSLIYVYDNNSTDQTAEIARRSGAVVRREMLQGKGYVLRRMFADIDADIYVVVDGDGTYDAASAPIMVQQLIEHQLDMVAAIRIPHDNNAYRSGHRLGNRVLTSFVATVFGRELTDMLTGYRIFTRRFVKSFPILSTGFEVETEITVHALELAAPVGEVATPYYARPEGSKSKLNTCRDGFRILWTIVRLYKYERPFHFFAAIGILLAFASILLAIPIFTTYFREGIVPRLPTALLSTALMLLASLSVTCGFILDTVTRGRREMKLLSYLTQRRPDVANVG